MQILFASVMEDRKNEIKWYVLQTVTGHENVAKQNLETVIRKNEYLQNRIFEIVIPMDEEIVEKDGKKVSKMVKKMPGYILVKMIYGDDLWHDVTRTPSIIAFVGPNARAIAISDEEVARLGLETSTFANQELKVGDVIEVLTGSFAGMSGPIESVDENKRTCTIKLVLFNRENQVELDFAQVKKL